MEDPMRTSADGQELGQLPQYAHGANQSEREDNGNRQNLWRLVDNVTQRTFLHDHLDRALERPHLTGITLSNLQPPYLF